MSDKTKKCADPKTRFAHFSINGRVRFNENIIAKAEGSVKFDLAGAAGSGAILRCGSDMCAKRFRT